MLQKVKLVIPVGIPPAIALAKSQQLQQHSPLLPLCPPLEVTNPVLFPRADCGNP
ncbi:hypothetical protein [Synechocystis salina]|uniref:Uncharacterized protein n=1 Tax=Synechocystis salina LEGE 00031 TaxID=1828736 RepID=A0ABR9VUN6_9SYNC|nr:hypothetical protein [Synechocystis salina]MBE9241762.1 hypothetical protein [Synechocystis salina LEGE 00041]MBE9255047.1 hypothetical protein [Synechocystis salina LEGE 00031]